MFLARAMPYVKHSGHYSVFFDIETGAPFIASPGFQKALEETLADVKKLAPEVLKYDPLACRNLIISGEAALAIGLETGPTIPTLTLGARSPQPAVASDAVKRADGAAIGFCRLPGTSEVYNSTLKKWGTAEDKATNQVTLTGFAGLCAGITSSATKPQAAAAASLLSSLLFSQEAVFPAGTRTLCRESQSPEASMWVGKQLSPSEAGKYVAVTANSLRDRQQVSELPVLGHAEFRAELTKGLTAALEQGKSPAEALSEVSTEWQKILDRLGTKRVLATYRNALGITKLDEF
jgi:hypothetical protein